MAGTIRKQQLDFVAEPRGDAYRSVIRCMQGICAEVLMIVRDDLGLTQDGLLLLRDLQRFLVAKDRSSSWPGTTLLEEEATVFRFVYDPLVQAALAVTVDGLYDWRQPDRPEDVCFLRADGTAILTTITHERDAYLEIDQQEYTVLRSAYPEIVQFVQESA